jgi:peptidoglycan hydrolase CwlO-like protein
MRDGNLDERTQQDVAARCREEQERLEAASRRLEEDNVHLEASLSGIHAQNEALTKLIEEQEAYLLEVEAQISRMEEQRHAWRQRYTELTGRALEDPVPAPPRS